MSTSIISLPFGRAFIEVFLLHSTSWVFLRFLTETFIEASHLLHPISQAYNISLPFVGTFIEAMRRAHPCPRSPVFPFLSEGLSLRVPLDMVLEAADISISLPVRKGFH